MNDYVATFHTHLSAMRTCNRLLTLGVSARMAPVPRKLSSSCGTCLFYRAETDQREQMDPDFEAVYQQESDTFRRILKQE